MTRRPVTLATAREMRRARLVRWFYHGTQAALVAALLGTCAAMAQDWSADCRAAEAVPGAVMRRIGTDTLVLAPHPQAQAQLCYHNDARQGSLAGSHKLTLGDLSVTVRISVGAGPETATIIPPPGHIVWPADHETVRVEDGEAVTVLIFGGIM